MTFTIRYTKATNHIEGITERTQASGDGMNYAVSACGSLSRSATRMSVGQRFEDLSEALKAAQANAEAHGRKVCKNCEKAAERAIIDAATAEHEDEEIDLTSTIGAVISEWLPEAEEPVSEPEQAEVKGSVIADVARTEPGTALVLMTGAPGFSMTPLAHIERVGSRWALVDEFDPDRKPITVRAGSIAKAIKAWAKRLGVTFDDMIVTKEF